MAPVCPGQPATGGLPDTAFSVDEQGSALARLRDLAHRVPDYIFLAPGQVRGRLVPCSMSALPHRHIHDSHQLFEQSGNPATVLWNQGPTACVPRPTGAGQVWYPNPRTPARRPSWPRLRQVIRRLPRVGRLAMGELRRVVRAWPSSAA